MSNSICKIKNNELIGNGFFCRIPYKNYTKINALITSYNIINENYFTKNNEIILLLSDYNEIKIIKNDVNRTIFFSKENYITIIEVKDYDYIPIYKYLELDDDNLFGNNLKTIYENKSIYILHFLNNGKASVSFGLVNKLDNSIIKHTCYSELNSSGAPILNLVNNKVIGITMNNNDIDINKGIIIKYSIEDFINKS